MEDKKVESTMVAEHLRDLSVSLMFVCNVADAELFGRTPLSCDARRGSHGRVSGL